MLLIQTLSMCYAKKERAWLGHFRVLSVIFLVCWSAGPSVVHPSLDIAKNTHYFLMNSFIKFGINKVKIVTWPAI